MAYIGVQPTDTYLSIASQQITGTGSATYTLDYSVSNEEDVAVFVNNVRQNVSTYTVSGTSLTLGGTISVSDSCWVLFLGRTVGTKTPAVGSVTNAMLAGSIATSKLADGSTFATTNGITNAQLFRVTSSFTGSGVITSNWEEADTDGSGSIGSNVSQSSGIFSFSTTGIYLIYFQLALYENVDQRLLQIQIQSSTDSGSSFDEAGTGYTFLKQQSDVVFSTAQTQFMFDVDNTSTRKIRFYTGAGSGTTNIGDTNANKTFATFIRLGDT